MKEWPLTQGQVALVDDDVFDRLVTFGRRWQASRHKRGFYAVTDIVENGKKRRVYMHRWILDEPDGVVDHKNGVSLDNQRENLRAVTQMENGLNRTIAPSTKSGFRGVGQTRSGNWRAYVNIEGTQINLGSYATPEAAAVVRDAYVEKYGAALNFKNAPMSLAAAQAQRTTGSRARQ